MCNQNQYKLKEFIYCVCEFWSKSITIETHWSWSICKIKGKGKRSEPWIVDGQRQKQSQHQHQRKQKKGKIHDGQQRHGSPEPLKILMLTTMPKTILKKKTPAMKTCYYHCFCYPLVVDISLLWKLTLLLSPASSCTPCRFSLFFFSRHQLHTSYVHRQRLSPAPTQSRKNNLSEM